MKDMKSMKGWFAVCPDVSSYRKVFHFLSQRTQSSQGDYGYVRVSLLSGTDTVPSVVKSDLCNVKQGCLRFTQIISCGIGLHL
jgi:hypothetical protein